MESALANLDLGRYRRIVQMIWDPEPSNNMELDQTIWCLGRSYNLRSVRNTASRNTNRNEEESLHKSPQSDTENSISSQIGAQALKNETKLSLQDTQTGPLIHARDISTEGSWPPAFIDDFRSKFWMTYRSDFQSIPKSNEQHTKSTLSLNTRIRSHLGDQGGFSSDSGWGCMIRSGQSLLANALGFLRLGRDWRQGEREQDERHIIRLFADDPQACYSVHNFVHHGAAACGKCPGEWFGPSATARCIEALVKANDPLLRVYSTGDSPDVYEDSFMQIAKPNDGEFHPTLILVSTRLGIDKITPVYWEALIASLQMPQSVGIAGGRPSSSHYFVGSQGLFLFYLDPHHTRKALPYHSHPAQYTNDEVQSCHTSRLRRVHVREMDPSMLIGFLIRSEDEWKEWRSCVKHVQGKAIIHVSDLEPRFQENDQSEQSDMNGIELLSDGDSEKGIF